jgi:hypothetical protein
MKQLSKSEKIRRYLDKGMTQKEIQTMTGYSPQLINIVNRNYNKKKKKATSESRRKVFNITMPKIEAEVRNVKAALDILNAEKVQVGEMPKKLIVKPVNLKAAMDILDKDWLDRDLVNSPPHYTTGGIETITFIEAKDLNYRLGNVIKYVSRAEKKGDPLADLKKARWYLEREIATRERA